MLTPEYLLPATEPAEEIAEQLHIDLINRIVERMMIRLKRGDKYLLTATDKWQIETLQQAGFLLEDIKKELANATEKLEKEIAEAMEDAGVRSLEYDDEIYRAAGLDPAPLRQSPNLIRIMQRDYEATMGDWENFTRTTANSIHTEFINACDTAYHQVVTGGLSSTQAVAEALDKAIGGGVVVRYPSGHEDTVETATARAVRTGISQATAHITDQRMDEMDWDTILVSSHFGARVTDKEDFTNHYWWQGKFYSKSGNDPRFPPFSVCNMGHVQGIHGANCRHHHGPGDGENNPFQEFDADKNKKQYELDQKQRAMERRIRKTKRELQNLRNAADKETDPEIKDHLEKQFERKSSLLKKQNEAYNTFCEETGQRRLPDRINVAKWERSETAKKSIKAAKDYEKRVAKIENNGNIKLPDIMFGRSLGAKAKNYKVMDLETGEMFSFVEGSKLQNVEVFAGKGTGTPYRKAYKYANRIGGKPEDWQHVKGNGWIAATDADRFAEVHWSQCEGFGKHDFFVKRWLD